MTHTVKQHPMLPWGPHLGVLLGMCLGTGCNDSEQLIDPFPILVDMSTGPVLIPVHQGDQSPVDVVLDVLSAITVLDSYAEGQPLASPRRNVVDLSLYSKQQNGNTIRRMLFPNTTTFDVHPCMTSATDEPVPCVAGDDGSRVVHGILGADILSNSSIRFDFPDSLIRFFPDSAGSVTQRTRSCDAVFSSNFGGGGTLRIDGSEVQYKGTRPTVGTCLHSSNIPEPGDSDSEIGSDMYMAISTALGPTLLTDTAYKRYVNDNNNDDNPDNDVPILDALPETTVYLPSGPVAGRSTSIPFLAIVGNAGSDSNGRGPCRELYANARMRVKDSCDTPGVDCPCPDNDKSCTAAAAIELSRLIPVVVVSNRLGMMQSLRDELRPDVPELDGIIGTSALLPLRVEFDWPNGRLLVRCLQLESCYTRPQVRSQASLGALDTCRQTENQLRNMLSPDPRSILTR